jgi:3'(2'), 5'-bisphosphate nucleotidase/myo-inositol-1(or 4)-monophosphatase
MKLSRQDLATLADVAINGAVSAGELISSYKNSQLDIINKKHSANGPHHQIGDTLASQVVTEVDFKSQEVILEYLLPTLQYYDLGLLSEESDDDGSRFKKDYFWSIDPLDGTLRFTEGKGGYSVAIALLDRKGDPHLGVVFDPLEKTVYHAIKGVGAFRNHQPFNLPPLIADAPLSLVHDRSFGRQKNYNDIIIALEDIAENLGFAGFHSYEYGGSVMNGCQVLEDSPALYFKFPQKKVGGGCIWDFAATTCIYNEIGAFATDIQGKPLQLNNPGTFYLNHCGVLFTGIKSVQERIGSLYLDLQHEKII